MRKPMGDVKWIIEALAATGKTQAELARAMNINPSGVNRLLKGERILRANELPVIERFLGVKSPFGAIGAEDRGRDYAGADFSSAEQSAPMFSASGDADGMTIIRTGDQPISMEIKPPRHANMRGLWSFPAVGEAMAPRFEPGETVWVNPHRQPRIGDDVLLIENREPSPELYCFLRKLVRETPKSWTARQHTPARESQFQKDEWRIALVLPRD